MARAAWKALRQDLLKDVSALGLLQGDPTALRVLQEREEALRVAASNSSFQQAKLASLLDLKGEHLEAKELLKGCSTSTCEPGEEAAIGFLQHLVLQHVRWQEERAMITDTNSKKNIRHVPVETVSAQVAGEEIWERFVKPGIPCVVRGVRLAPLQTLDDLAPLGSVQIPMRRCNENSTNWARLEADGMIRFDDFLETFIAPFQHSHSGPAPRNSPQLFDFSIWQHCAKTLGNQVLMPSKWFPVDLYTYASVKMQPISGSAGPTLFVAPAGSGSSLHVDLRGEDTLQTNFWMFMCFGRKRWRLVSRDDLSLLHPRYLCDLNPVFPADLNAFQDGQTEKLRQLTIHEISLEADDLIFVPAGWPHQVDNLETSVAMSANFIDASNVQRCIEEAEVMAIVEENPGLWVLRRAVAEDQLQRLQLSGIEAETLRSFKARHGEARAPAEVQRRILGILSATGLAMSVIGWYWYFGKSKVEPKETVRHLTKITV